MSISVVVAKVVRENEQYKYRLVGKGEKYIVQHHEVDNAGEMVAKYLSPFAKEPVVIESVALQKSTEIIADISNEEGVYKAVVQFAEEDPDTGKIRKYKRNYFVGGDNFAEAYDKLMGEANNWMGLWQVLSLTKTNIIEYLV